METSSITMSSYYARRRHPFPAPRGASTKKKVLQSDFNASKQSSLLRSIDKIEVYVEPLLKDSPDEANADRLRPELKDPEPVPELKDPEPVPDHCKPSGNELNPSQLIVPNLGHNFYQMHTKQAISPLNCSAVWLPAQKKKGPVLRKSQCEPALEPRPIDSNALPQTMQKRQVQLARMRSFLNLPTFGESLYFTDDMVTAISSKAEETQQNDKELQSEFDTSRRHSWHCNDLSHSGINSLLTADIIPSKSFMNDDDTSALLMEPKSLGKKSFSLIKSPLLTRMRLNFSKRVSSQFNQVKNDDEVVNMSTPRHKLTEGAIESGLIDLPSFSLNDNQYFVDDMMITCKQLNKNETQDSYQDTKTRRNSCPMPPRPQDSHMLEFASLCEDENDTKNSESGFDNCFFLDNPLTGLSFPPEPFSKIVDYSNGAKAAPPPSPILCGTRATFGRSESVSTQDIAEAACEVTARWPSFNRPGSFTSRGSIVRQGSISSQINGSHVKNHASATFGGAVSRRSSLRDSIALEEALQWTMACGGPAGLGRSESVSTIDAAQAAQDVGVAFNFSRSSMMSIQDVYGAMATVEDCAMSGSSDDDLDCEKDGHDEVDHLEIDLGLSDLAKSSAFYMSPESRITKQSNEPTLEFPQEIYDTISFKSPEVQFPRRRDKAPLEPPRRIPGIDKDPIATAIEAAAGALRGGCQTILSSSRRRRGATTATSSFMPSPGRSEEDYITPNSQASMMSGCSSSRLLLPHLSNISSPRLYHREFNANQKELNNNNNNNNPAFFSLKDKENDNEIVSGSLLN